MQITQLPPNGNPGTVPDWLQHPIPFPLPDPIGDTPRILPIELPADTSYVQMVARARIMHQHLR